MRIFLTTSLLAVVLALPASGFAGSRPNPYQNLFTAQLAPPRAKPLAAAVPFIMPPSSPFPTQRIVCGLTVVQGDAKIDRTMPHHASDKAPKPTIKMFPAPACQR
jgi:hypothetical protein